jgi:predicted Rossmann fold nucleotide-binding protein DprA/Smf involved in DNA uptake
MSETVGFTGTRSANHRDAGKIADILAELSPDSTVVTGACVGVDMFVAAIARRLGMKVHTVVPADRSRVGRLWRQNCTTFEEMPPGTDYRDRNERIVALSDRVIAIPEAPEDAPESRRSGTWMTVRIARRAGKSVQVEPLK